MAIKELTQEKSSCHHCIFTSFCQRAAPASPLVSGRQLLKRRESLYSYRDAFSHLYAIKSGAVKTFHVDLEGQESIHQFYLAGEILGFEAIYLNHYPFSAIAITNTTVCRIPYERLINLISSRPDLNRHLLTSISQRFSFGQYVTAPTADQRLSAFLLELSRRQPDCNTPIELDLCMSRQDIGNYLGLAAETISRILSRFQKNRLLVIKSKKIKLLDHTQLQWIAQDGLAKSGSIY